MKLADELANLTKLGIKCATSSALAEYTENNEPLPIASDKFDIILNSSGQPVCAIRTSRIYIKNFHDVSAEHAFKEGEGLPPETLGKQIQDCSKGELAYILQY